MRALLVLGFLLLTARDAFAAKKPTTPAELLLVQQLQADVNQVQILQSGLDQLNAAITNEKRKIAPNLMVIAGYEQQLPVLENQKLLLCNKAIKLAIKAYDLAPARPTAVLVVGAVNRLVTWVPVYGDRKEGVFEPRYIQDARGESVLVQGQAAAALTWPDGAITISTSAFTSPAMLAAIILHETVHFEQRTTSGVGDKISSKQMEFSAHMAMLANKDKLGLSTAEMLSIQKSLTEAMNKPAGGHFVGTPEINDARPEPIKSGGDDVFLGAIRDLPGITEETRRQIREQREEAQRRIVREKEQNHLNVQRWMEDQKRSRDYMWALAGQACSDPESLDMLADEGEIIPANMDAMDSSYGVTDTSGPGSLSTCQARVLDQIDALRRRRMRVVGADFANAARAYRRAHPSIGEKIGKLVTGFIDSFKSLAEHRENGPVVEPSERASREPRSFTREPKCFVDSNGVRACCVANCD